MSQNPKRRSYAQLSSKVSVHSSGFAEEVIGNLFDDKKHESFENKNTSELPAAAARLTLVGVLSSITVEPPIFVRSFVYELFTPVFSYMFMQKLCTQTCGFSSEQCHAFGTGANVTLDTTVQKSWAQYANYAILISSVPEIFFALFIGSWSDIFGRKPLMVLPFIGTLLSLLFGILLYYIPSLPIWMMFLPSLRKSLFGGETAMWTGSYSHVADISRDGNTRTIRIAAIDSAIALGHGAGGIISGAIVRSGAKAYVNYSAALVIAGLGLLYVLIRIHETRRPDRPHSAFETVARFFTLRNLASSYEVMTKKRLGRTRRNLWLLLAAFFFFMAIFMAEIDINQKFFMGAPLHWSLEFFVTFDGSMSFFRMAGLAAFVVIGKKVLDCSDATIGMAACLSRIAYSYTLSIAKSNWMVYLGSLFGVLKFGTALSIRSLMSKMVPEDEQGRVFALVAVIDVISPMAGSAAVTAIFTATAGWWPSFYNLVSAYMAVIPLAILALVDYYVRCEENEANAVVQNKDKVAIKDDKRELELSQRADNDLL